MSGSGGYGVAGHKHAYATGVRCGNWVEDSVGAELAARAVVPVMAGESEARRHFSDPAGKAAARPEQAGERPSMRGLEQTVLLAHCEKGNVHAIAHDPARFQTTHATSFAGGRVDASCVSTSKARERSLAAARAARASPFETTYSDHASAPYRAQAGALVGKPSGERRACSQGFTKSFLQAQAFESIRKDAV
jgi:hypothetical protein